MVVGAVVGAFDSGHSSSDPDLAVGPGTRAALNTPTPPLQPRAASAPLRGPRTWSRPVSLRIPVLGLDAEVRPLGLNPDHTIEVPADPDLVGWYRLGPVPGQVGSAVILGHLDSRTGPAVFYRLKSLRPGDEVAVIRADGAVAHFVVHKLTTYSNARFPAARIYGSHGMAQLQLITCGGRYDRRVGSYTANVVVYTRLASLTPAPPMRGGVPEPRRVRE